MWALLSRRIRMWLLLAVGVPVLARVLDAVADRMEERGGESSTTRGLHGGAHWLKGKQRGRRGQQQR